MLTNAIDLVTIASHGVEGGSILEPLNLGLVEGVAELDVEGGTVLGVDTQSDGLANLELSAEEVDLVLGLDLVVVGGVGEGKRKHTLLLQVGLVLKQAVSLLQGEIVSPWQLTIRAKLRVMMARPPR